MPIGSTSNERINEPSSSSKGAPDSDIESDASVASYCLPQTIPPPAVRGRKRGRPRKTDTDCGRSGTPIMRSNEIISAQEALKWNPDRIDSTTRFILGSKVSRLLAASQRGNLYVKYPRIFRYIGDEEDRAWLVENRLTTRLSGKIFILMLEDAYEIATLENYLGSKSELERFSFLLPIGIITKMKRNMAEIFEHLKVRVSPDSLSQIF
ncbi:hypothetical protein AB6A40_011159 [Gnathostoma spinigerum]|uniref:TdIF1 C-terminal domain-containing protein n=1 Tax=Gnathostoma spinigerum TaxID=75299 RepID=A0ABD6F4C7_9BILA